MEAHEQARSKSVRAYVYVYGSVPVCRSLLSSLDCLPVCAYLCPRVCVYACARLAVYLSVCLPAINLSVFLCVCVGLSVRLSVTLPLRARVTLRHQSAGMIFV